MLYPISPSLAPLPVLNRYGPIPSAVLIRYGSIPGAVLIRYGSIPGAVSGSVKWGIVEGGAIPDFTFSGTSTRTKCIWSNSRGYTN